MADKKIFVTKPYLPKKEEFNKYVDQIWENQYLTNKGPLHNEFQDVLKRYLEVENVNLTVNGHMALDIAIKGLGLTGEVITTPFTFASTTHALTLNNIKPVFCDIKESDLTIDENKIESLINDKTSAILAVHVYGHPCNVEKIQEIADKHNLKVIYDAAHAFGVQYKGKSLVCYGDASIFSFHATKLFHTIEGGAIVYSNDDYTRIFNAYKNFGIEGEDKIDYIGLNAKMNEFQAAMGLTNLKHISEIIQERKDITNLYRKELDNTNGITMYHVDCGDTVYNYAYLPIRIDPIQFGESRDEVYSRLKENNIYSRRYFWPIVTEFGCYKKEYGDSIVDVAKKVGDEILCLPIYNGLSKENIKEVCDIILNNKRGV